MNNPDVTQSRIEKLQRLLADDRAMVITYQQAVEIAESLNSFYHALAEPGASPSSFQPTEQM